MTTDLNAAFPMAMLVQCHTGADWRAALKEVPDDMQARVTLAVPDEHGHFRNVPLSEVLADRARIASLEATIDATYEDMGGGPEGQERGYRRLCEAVAEIAEHREVK